MIGNPCKSHQSSAKSLVFRWNSLGRRKKKNWRICRLEDRLRRAPTRQSRVAGWGLSNLYTTEYSNVMRVYCMHMFTILYFFTNMHYEIIKCY